MSRELVWECIRNQHSFMLVRSGERFSRDPTNIRNLNNPCELGLINKSAGLQVKDKRVYLLKHDPEDEDNFKPEKFYTKVPLKRGVRSQLRDICDAVYHKKFSHKLHKYVIARAYRIGQVVNFKPKVDQNKKE